MLPGKAVLLLRERLDLLEALVPFLAQGDQLLFLPVDLSLRTLAILFQLLPYLPLSGCLGLLFAEPLLALLQMGLMFFLPLRVDGLLFLLELLAGLVQGGGIGLESGELLLVAFARLVQLPLHVFQGGAQACRLGLRFCNLFVGGRGIAGGQLVADLLEFIFQDGDALAGRFVGRCLRGRGRGRLVGRHDKGVFAELARNPFAEVIGTNPHGALTTGTDALDVLSHGEGYRREFGERRPG